MFRVSESAIFSPLRWVKKVVDTTVAKREAETAELQELLKTSERNIKSSQCAIEALNEQTEHWAGVSAKLQKTETELNEFIELLAEKAEQKLKASNPLSVVSSLVKELPGIEQINQLNKLYETVEIEEREQIQALLTRSTSNVERLEDSTDKLEKENTATALLLEELQAPKLEFQEFLKSQETENPVIRTLRSQLEEQDSSVAIIDVDSKPITELEPEVNPAASNFAIPKSRLHTVLDFAFNYPLENLPRIAFDATSKFLNMKLF